VIAVGGDLTTCGVEKIHQILEKTLMNQSSRKFSFG